MNPIAPAPVNTNAQGVGSVAPVGAPTPTALPTAPAQINVPAPTVVSRPDISGQLSAISNFYKIPAQTAQLTSEAQSRADVAQGQFEAQKYNRQIDIQNQKDMLDPSKYLITKDPKTGGINITNIMGDKVDLGTYSNLTGANPADVLKNSTDPNDIKFVQAYNNFQNYAQAKIAATNGDLQAQATVKQFNDRNSGLQNVDLGQLKDAFMQQYGTYFGAPQDNGSALTDLGVNPTLTQANNPKALSAYYGGYPSIPPGGGQSAPPTTNYANMISSLAAPPGQ